MKRAIALTVMLACAIACGPGSGEMKTWETSADDGPEKLAATVKDDRDRIDKRRDAALALTRVVRRHRHVGLDVLLDTFAAMPAPSRDAVLAAMVPELVRKTTLVRPLTGGDPSLTTKDATYALLSRGLVADAKHKSELTAALLTWTKSETLARLDDGSQRYSCQQAMRLLGAPAVHDLPALLPNAARPDRIVGLVLELGDAPTKDAMRAALIALARTLRAERLTGLLDSMKRIGGPTVVEYMLTVAGDKAQTAEVRAHALKSMESHVADLSASQIDRVSAIAGDDATPDVVRDAAFARIAELPNSTPRLYAFFASKSWKTRYGAALALLPRLAANDIGEFMDHLPQKPNVAMDAREPLAYAPRLLRLAGKAGLVQWLGSKSFGARITALSAYRGDPLKLAASENDKTKLPSCTKDQSCEWFCHLDTKAVGGVLLSPETPTTVGELVRFCLEPHGGAKGPDAADLELEADKLQKDLLKSLGGAR